MLTVPIFRWQGGKWFLEVSQDLTMFFLNLKSTHTNCIFAAENTCINAYTYTPGAVIPPGFHWPKETGPGDGVSLLHLLSDLTALPDADLGKQQKRSDASSKRLIRKSSLSKSWHFDACDNCCCTEVNSYWLSQRHSHLSFLFLPLFLLSFFTLVFYAADSNSIQKSWNLLLRLRYVSSTPGAKTQAVIASCI